jgi:protease IV
LWDQMKKRPFLMASLTVGGIFLFFLLVVFTAGFFQNGSVVVPVGDKIGILEIEGTIFESRPLLKQIKEFSDRGSIKAVVLRVNSPGGSVAPSQELYVALKRLAEVKPLVVSMGSVAASGGYYLAIAGKHLFANPGTITGSIGVIMSFPNYQELMGKVGVQTEVIKSGRFKDIGSSTRAFTSVDRELLQELIDDVHLQFVEAVSKERKIPVERLQPFVDGRIFTGRQAQKVGLIDELGTFTDAVDYAAELVGITDDPDLVYPDIERQNIFERYLENTASRYLGVNISVKQVIGPQYLWNAF